MFSDRTEWNPRDYCYDIETYPNVFTCVVLHVATRRRWVFEISDRRNNWADFVQLIQAIKSVNGRMVGFNNLGFDYPVIHEGLHCLGGPTAALLYHKAQSIIDAPFDRRFDHVVWESDQIVQQIDLYKIHHFDNPARSTGLKVLEINMLSEDVGDLPFAPGTYIEPHQIDTIIQYNDHDVDETAEFYKHSVEMIEFREELTERYDRNFLNHNDTKIGKDYFIMRLEESGIPCFTRDGNGRRVPRQTWRHSMALRDVVFPYIRFNHPEFRRVHSWLMNQVITETKGVFNNLTATVDGFEFVFGTGGIHGSVSSQTVKSDDDNVIIDLDVAGYYPSLGIANRLYPEHLGESFCDYHADIKNERKKHKKGTAPNTMLKLAGNGVYGDSNNVYSPFYDPIYTMKITINGQLLLCMLAEYLMQIPGLRMIQANTDGLTVLCPRDQIDQLNQITEWWQRFTCLELERAEYSRMFIRDVNNYIAEKTDGKLKRIGAYCHVRPWEKDHDLEWHQDHSALVVQKAAEAALVHGVDVEQFIRNHRDPFDFLLRARAKGKSRLVTTDSFGNDIPEQKTTRYYVATIGYPLTMIHAPLAGKDVERRVSIQTGRNVFIANNARRIDMTNIDFSWYIDEANKLVKPVRGP